MRITRSAASTVQNNLHDSFENDDIDDVYMATFRYTLTKNQIEAGMKFDKELKHMQWNYCRNCKAEFPNLKLNNSICNCCQKDPRKYTLQNNMDPGDIPDHLPELNSIEEMLVALNHPMVVVYRKRGGQHHYSGHVINFPQNISTYVRKLPHTINHIPYYIIFDAKSKSGKVELEADASKLRMWLLWLKKNNDYYRHIEIDENNLTILEESNNIAEQLKSTEVDEKTVDNHNEGIYTNVSGADLQFDDQKAPSRAV